MTFHIGHQSGGVINNVGGDQHIQGGQHGTYAAGEPDLVQVVQQLRDALDAARLPQGTAQGTKTHVEELHAAVSGPEPDRQRAAGALDRLTRLLVSAGPLATAAAALTGPMAALARWLGPLGQAALQLIPGL